MSEMIAFLEYESNRFAPERFAPERFVDIRSDCEDYQYSHQNWKCCIFHLNKINFVYLKIITTYLIIFGYTAT